MNNLKIKNSSDKVIANTYARFPIAISKGQGAYVWDADGKQYLDFVSGLAVCNLGHCHPAITKAIQEQAAKLLHVSNLYYTEPQNTLAGLLIAHSFADKVFFCNSGAEANEAAIKLARRYSFDHHGDSRQTIITMNNSFHGRTMATLTATGQQKVKTGFTPLLPGFKHVEFNNIDALTDAIDDSVCAVMLEPIQGEGGVIVASDTYLKQARDLCDKAGILLIYDEVQVGMGRTGRLFAYEHAQAIPDIMTLAKGLAGGAPIGAMLASENVINSFVPGTHATTFGGNPLVTAAGAAAFNALVNEGVVDNCLKMEILLKDVLDHFSDKYAFIKEVRGKGLIYAMELDFDGSQIVNKAMNKGLLINNTATSALRFLPPLIISPVDIEKMADILGKILDEC